MPTLVNPNASQLGGANAVIAGRARWHEARFVAPISIKSVVSGVASWETAQGRFEVTSGSALILGDQEEYELTIDALQPVETFCLFFAHGFVEDAYAAATRESDALLDNDRRSAIEIHERMQFRGALVETVRAAQRHGADEATFYALANALVRMQTDVRARIARLPALRTATRNELARRVGIATSFLHANIGGRTTVEDAASAACLSPFHFHRLFTAFHGTTPHRYITQLRMDRARTFLRHSDAPVLDVALACGFESLGSFTTLFTRTFGVPPARFRKNRETAAGPAALASTS